MAAGGSSTAALPTLADGTPCSLSAVKTATRYKGEAAVIFSKAEVDKLATPFRWALVGKFSHGRPSLEGIRKFFSTLNLKDQVSVGLLDYRHVLLKCSAEQDFNLGCGMWQLGKYPMRVFRWTRDFHVKKESALAPVWASLPALPIHYFDKHSLFSILAPVRKPLFLDSATAAGTRPSVARVCVEVDLLKPICSRVWVAVEGELGFWQNIVLDDTPKYCSACWRLGHLVEECKKDGAGVMHKGKQTLVQQQEAADAAEVAREIPAGAAKPGGIGGHSP
ncbi:uncharacterized protein LOC113766259 [Coffea eugenioides]|uniref:uncharacterized protein LOC113756637 n=1 Tax=Coffea eugenioides TaxID=49369 RepID=UPI000F608603|nr:uncharacterized protein LOC113756637 [Coffea eugenioides]XP_027166266.1 uncharacterized protein LOC113766255 [Coffea eugenioides]XP_027166270.1 uncharacterized protein LOC113766259 [Coffea eugenioides]